ncbi:hypothetical protein Tco_0017118 [Tanacetum coccineum]
MDLSTYLFENGFRRCTIDKTLFIKKEKSDILLVQVYVDDIIFGSTKKSLCDEFEAEAVDVHLNRSMIGSLMYLTAFRPDIIYLKGQPKLGLWYPRDSPFDLEAFSDSDYARASLDMKSLTGGSGPRCQVTILAGAKAQTRFEAASKQSMSTSYMRLMLLLGDINAAIALVDVFWATAKVKTVNGERQLQALVDKKKVIITETSIRSDLNLEGMAEPMTEKETNEESVPTHFYDPSQSREDRMQLHELMNLCTKLPNRVLALETTKTTQALEIASLKSRHDVIPKEVSTAETLTTTGIKFPVSTGAPSTTVVSPPVITEV